MRNGKFFRILGCVLILCGLALVLATGYLNRKARQDAPRIAARIHAIVPTTTTGSVDNYTDMDMPALQIEGRDYVALIRIPAYGVELPVGSSWDTKQIWSHPCRFWGTVYNGSLVVGGVDQPGQLDFLDRIDLGCQILVTDMTGGEFSYLVERIELRKQADAETLLDETADLTLFVRDTYSLEYLIVRCKSGS